MFENGLNRILISGLFAGISAEIGTLLYSKIKHAKSSIKGVSLIMIFFVGILGIYLIDSIVKSNSLTCEVCGYIAVNKNNTECNYCFSETWEALDYKDEFENKMEWLREEQLFWFTDLGSNDSIFYFPREIDGFKKDISWKPVINYNDIEKYKKIKDDIQ